MEHIRRDSNLSPPPTEIPVVPLIQADPFLLPPNSGALGAEDPTWPSPQPSATNPQLTDEPRPPSRQSLHPEPAEPKFEPPRSKLQFWGFERPGLSRIVILTALCFLTYPASMASHLWRRIGHYSSCGSSSPSGVRASDLPPDTLFSRSEHGTSKQRVSPRRLGIETF